MVDTGGRAFPTQMGCEDGMWLRDWLAGMAMQSMIAGSDLRSIAALDLDTVAGNAYYAADKMIAEKRLTEKESGHAGPDAQGA